MILVLSGEGPSDIGTCSNALGNCSDGDFIPGPMTVIIDQMIAALLGYSMRELPDSLYFISETLLAERSKKLPMRLKLARSKKIGSETGYYHSNATALGVIAKELEDEVNDVSVAILFRDSDGTRSAPTTLWDTKWESMRSGFLRSEFLRGVPMLPKPTSEAWLLCAAQKQAYQNCDQLEELSGNQASPNHPKKKLNAAFGEHKSTADLCEWLDDIAFDSVRAESMPSFKAFKDELERVVNDLIH